MKILIAILLILFAAFSLAFPYFAVSYEDSLWPQRPDFTDMPPPRWAHGLPLAIFNFGDCFAGCIVTVNSSYLVLDFLFWAGAFIGLIRITGKRKAA